MGGLYLVAASWVLYDALTCQTMLCGLTGMIVTLPSWAVFRLIYECLDQIFVFGYITSHVEDFLMFPALILNTLLIYLLGKLLAWAWNKIAF